MPATVVNLNKVMACKSIVFCGKLGLVGRLSPSLQLRYFGPAALHHSLLGLHCSTFADLLVGFRTDSLISHQSLLEFLFQFFIVFGCLDHLLDPSLCLASQLVKFLVHFKEVAFIMDLLYWHVPIVFLVL